VITPQTEADDSAFGFGAAALAMRSFLPVLDNRRVRLRRHPFRYGSFLLWCVFRASTQFNPASAVVAVLHGHTVVEALAFGIAAFPRMPGDIAMVTVAHRFLQRIYFRDRNFEFFGKLWVTRQQPKQVPSSPCRLTFCVNERAAKD